MLEVVKEARMIGKTVTGNYRSLTRSVGVG